MFKRLIEWMINVFEPAQPIVKPKPRPQVKGMVIKKTMVIKTPVKKTIVSKTTTTKGSK
jgi:hypothetical protein